MKQKIFMSWSQMLAYLNNKFINSSLKVKIELYILPLLFLYIVYYFLIDLNNNEKIPEIKNNINYSDYTNKKFDGSSLELLSSIENFSREKHIIIKSINEDKNLIQIKADGKIENISELIKKIENINSFTKIDLITIKNQLNQDSYYFEMKIDLNKFYIKKLIKEENINTSNNVLAMSVNKYKINAIVADYVLINSIWLRKNEMIDDFKLIEIKKNFVLLKNNSEEIKLEL